MAQKKENNRILSVLGTILIILGILSYVYTFIFRFPPQNIHEVTFGIVAPTILIYLGIHAMLGKKPQLPKNWL